MDDYSKAWADARWWCGIVRQAEAVVRLRQSARAHIRHKSYKPAARMQKEARKIEARLRKESGI